MKVIKEGCLPKLFPAEGKCSRCGAVFECDESDLVDRDWLTCVVCPTKGCNLGIPVQRLTPLCRFDSTRNINYEALLAASRSKTPPHLPDLDEGFYANLSKKNQLWR